MKKDKVYQDIISARNILSLVNLIVETENVGKTIHLGACPFHVEHTPSFVVYQDKEKFYCFSCGVSGDRIDFCHRIVNTKHKDNFLKQLTANIGDKNGT